MFLVRVLQFFIWLSYILHKIVNIIHFNFNFNYISFYKQNLINLKKYILLIFEDLNKILYKINTTKTIILCNLVEI